MKRTVASTRRLAGAAVIFFVLAVVLLSVSYFSQGPRGNLARKTTITIPEGADVPPAAFNVTDLLNGRYHYPWNLTVIIGVNNTLVWVNADDQSHTVSSFIVPPGAAAFNSNLIAPGENFSVSLSVPGIYKYACLWHPWLAGEVIVRSP